MKTIRLWPLLLLLAMPAPAAGAGEVQVYRKADGSMLFTNRPPALIREPGMRLLETRVYRDGHYKRPPRRLTAQRRDTFDRLISEAAAENDLDFSVVKAVIHAESAFDPEAVSRAGARGLMQLMPATARLLHVKDIHDPADNIAGGARYLRMMMDKFRGNLRYALAAYNAGPANVQKYGGIPPFEETRDYVEKVMDLSGQYRELHLARR